MSIQERKLLLMSVCWTALSAIEALSQISLESHNKFPGIAFKKSKFYDQRLGGADVCLAPTFVFANPSRSLMGIISQKGKDRDKAPEGRRASDERSRTEGL